MQKIHGQDQKQAQYLNKESKASAKHWKQKQMSLNHDYAKVNDTTKKKKKKKKKQNKNKNAIEPKISQFINKDKISHIMVK